MTKKILKLKLLQFSVTPIYIRVVLMTDVVTDTFHFTRETGFVFFADFLESFWVLRET